MIELLFRVLIEFILMKSYLLLSFLRPNFAKFCDEKKNLTILERKKMNFWMNFDVFGTIFIRIGL